MISSLQARCLLATATRAVVALRLTHTVAAIVERGPMALRNVPMRWSHAAAKTE